MSNQFSIYLTRAVGEILKDGGGPDSFLKLPGYHLNLTSPADGVFPLALEEDKDDKNLSFLRVKNEESKYTKVAGIA